MGMSGQAEVYRPLADGEIVCTSPSLGSTAGAGGIVNARSNRLCRACTKRQSTLPDRGQAIGRWSGFDSRQGGSGILVQDCQGRFESFRKTSSTLPN
jgi:hypothetical protein